MTAPTLSIRQRYYTLTLLTCEGSVRLGHFLEIVSCRCAKDNLVATNGKKILCMHVRMHACMYVCSMYVCVLCMMYLCMYVQCFLLSRSNFLYS